MHPAEQDLYSVLGVSRDASAKEITRAFKTLRTSAHPDRGGDASIFVQLVAAHAVLSDPDKRAHYDLTGQVVKSADEELREAFGTGSRTFQAAERAAVQPPPPGQLAVRIGDLHAPSHSAGFEAWMRARGSGGVDLFTADSMADLFGVNQGSYQPVALDPSATSSSVMCTRAGAPSNTLVLSSAPLPAYLEWGQVLVEMKLAPVSPADLYSARMGGVYGSDAREVPFVCGHDGVGIVTKVGPGVRHVAEGDVVLPLATFAGTWRQLAVCTEKELLRVGRMVQAAGTTPADPSNGPASCDGGALPLPLEYLAVSRELCTAYRLLEQHKEPKPGHCVILNAATSTVGRCVLQLCRLLQLRAVAVVSPCRKCSTATGVSAAAAAAPRCKHFEAQEQQLTALGATLVLPEGVDLKASLSDLRFFAQPLLALDAVGGECAVQLAESLQQGGHLVVYGCMSGKPAVWPWQAWVFRGLRVSGFNMRAWAAAHGEEGYLHVLRMLGKLVRSGMLELQFIEYALEDEWVEAVEHAAERGKSAKVLLSCSRRGRCDS